MGKARYQPGDPVIYRMPKHSTRPGPRAIHVDPAPRGEMYTYEVDKFWVVAEVQHEGKQLLLRTRRGKEHVVDCDDPHLRRPGWIEWFMYRRRFPALNGAG